MTTPRILVVEDNPDLRVEIVDYLNFCNYRAEAVANLQAMRQAIEYEHWNIILLDLTLPDGDGLKAAAELRDRHGWQLGIIMVTARGHVEDRIDGVTAGADAYLVKPINLKELKVNIDHLALRLKQSKRPAEPVEKWTLDDQTLRLHCPNGQSVDVTVTESLLLKELLRQPGHPLVRDSLCELLPPGSGNGTRRLDTILSRLRSKVKSEAGINLPIHTLRNKGYMFAGNRRESDRQAE